MLPLCDGDITAEGAKHSTDRVMTVINLTGGVAAAVTVAPCRAA